jgi:transcription-repair coupling factor (superfamily II helicase)
MKDRLGQAPPEANNLIALMEIKLLLKKAWAKRIEVGPETMVLTFGEKGPSNYDKVIALVSGSTKNKLTPTGRLYVSGQPYSRGPNALAGVKEFLARVC